jgi:hypothetical protein
MTELEPQLENVARKDAEFLTWTFSGAPIQIDIRLEVFRKWCDEADRVVAQGRLFETGGVLLGHSRSATTIEISGYLFIPSEPNPIPGYVLDTSALEALPSLRSRPREDQASVVGYFRIQQDLGLLMRDDEIELVGRYFNDPQQVVLLIGASALQSSAGFMFWDEDVFNPFPLMKFALDSELLRSEEETLSNEPELTEVCSPVPVEQVETAVKEKNRYGLLLRWPIPVISAAVVLLAVLLAFLIRDRFRGAPRPSSPAPIRTASAPPANFPLQLEVETQANGLNIRWNPKSLPVTQAQKGRLVIIDNGGDTQVLILEPEQLLSGHVYYQSLARRVEFRLEVIDNTGGVAKESVLALSSKPPGQVQSTAIVRPGTQSLSAGKPRVIEPLPPSKPPARTFTIPPPSRTLPTAEPTVVVEQPPSLPNMPSSVPSALLGPMGAAPLIKLPLPTPAPRERPPAAADPKPAQASKLPVQRNPAVPAELYHAVVPKSKATPILQRGTAALIPQDARIEVIVRVQIDQMGRVVGARALPRKDGLTGNAVVYSQLVEPSVAAAMRWRYEPARLGVKLVPSEDEIVFVFQHTSSTPDRPR